MCSQVYSTYAMSGEVVLVTRGADLAGCGVLVLVLVLGAAAAAPKRWAPNAKRYALHARARRNNCALVRCSDADGVL